ncbi:sensor histidine kinase [Helicobacter cholecystus]|uniref:histidine kinase n=1 Tax=Helicobacter cholecystus TaxID=45498 RepID=A0A3D8IWF2_9HELI|nr:HAMP domain-containing sensor histidine kinase [Helicobacter cholecystus]RDU69286.1 sensor histidine kinase [Helicobacter cholecystus]VEJ24364.1 two-component sensor histidine kinase [Helicobacter cholecystus]
MEFLHKIKDKLLGTSLQRKTKILILNTLVGLFLISSTTIISLFGLKYDYDSTFINQERKLKQLIVIQNLYSNLLIHYISKEKTDASIKELQDAWRIFDQISEMDENYATKFKDFYTRLFLDYEIHLNKLTNDEIKIAQIINHEIIEQTPSFELFKTTVINLNFLLHQAIELRIEILNIKKQATNSLFLTSLFVVAILLAMIILTTLFFSHIIISSIKELHHSLQKIVNKKTQELRNLNEHLQKRIKDKIMQLRQKDQIMYQQARLASMGEMIQNIAHQWRQPLNSLTLLIQSFQSKSENGKLTHQFICDQTKNALRIAKNMSDTIENFRNFFHPHNVREDFCIQKSIQDALSILSSNLKSSDIEFYTPSEKQTMFFGYENAFSQVILNLINNAKDAIILEHIQKGMIEIDVVEDRNEIKIIVQDNAGGIKLKEINKIFEPYFTTKHKSLGTGIGLYMVKQIIENQMKGKILINNSHWISKITKQEYFGAVFTILLPKALDTQGE